MPIIFLAYAIATAAIATGIFKLGALSVWVTVLSMALKASITVIFAAVLRALALLAWGRWKA